MTICIASIAKEGENEFIVFSTDHMVSTGVGQFEHSLMKHQRINHHTVAMLAGRALLFDDLVKMDSIDTLTFTQIKKNIFENFKKKRNDIINDEIFNIFGIDRDFIINSLKQPIPNPFVGSILDKISNFNLETGILLAGFEEGKAQISEINGNGFMDFRSMGFHAIGSGGNQGAYTLLFQKQSKKDTLRTTVYNVYKAKRNAEISEGVGKETELMILSIGGVNNLSEKELAILNDIYNLELKYGKTNSLLKNISLPEVE